MNESNELEDINLDEERPRQELGGFKRRFTSMKIHFVRWCV